MDTVKVKCLGCKKSYHVKETDVPHNIKEGEAFPGQCPYNCCGKYAELEK